MIHKVTVTFEIDSEDYDENLETPDQVADLAMRMLRRDADLPKEAAVEVRRPAYPWSRDY